MHRQLTAAILGVVTAALIAYDVWVYLAGGPSATISVVIRDFAARYPSVPFVLGGLCAHWLWPLSPAKRQDQLVCYSRFEDTTKP